MQRGEATTRLVLTALLEGTYVRIMICCIALVPNMVFFNATRLVVHPGNAYTARARRHARGKEHC